MPLLLDYSTALLAYHRTAAEPHKRALGDNLASHIGQVLGNLAYRIGQPLGDNLASHIDQVLGDNLASHIDQVLGDNLACRIGRALVSSRSPALYFWNKTFSTRGS